MHGLDASAAKTIRLRSATALVPRAFELACFALIVAQGVYLAASYWQGSWLATSGVPTDFVNVWAAGKMALAGNAAAAYDWPAHKAMEVLALGHDFDGYFGWHYPPTFLFLAAGLALFPYVTANVLWSFATFPAYLAAIRAIVGDRAGWMLAAAFPAVLCNFVVGQNGFLSAALLGTGLLLIGRRPILAGVFIALLSFKPHLGLLIPVALIAGGHWRTFLSAGLVTTIFAAASAAAFGFDAWQAFVANLGHTSQAFLSDGWADWGKLQSAFGLTRVVGGSESLAWSVQAVVTSLAAASVAVIWRSGSAHEIKAAALSLGALLATPYLYTYDLVVLAVPLAFMLRQARVTGFLPHELAGIGLACFLVLIFPFAAAPVGFAAILVVAALLARRVRAATPLHPAQSKSYVRP